jgi:hypothetical protein
MDRVFSATGADRVVSAERSGGGEPLAVGGYNLAASVDGVTTDTATLILNEQSVRDVTTAVAPGSASLESVPRIVDATTERPRVAGGDQLVLRVEATGVSGVLDGAYDLDADGADAGTHGVALELAEANGSGVVDVSGATVVPDREADRYYVVFEPDAVSSLRPNTNYTARFLIDDRNPFVASGEELAVSTEFRIVERTATFDASEDEIRVEKPALDGEASVYGDSTVAPGTQLLVVMRGTGNSTLFQTDTVTVSRYGSWRARFDLEGVPEETTVTLKVRDGSAVVSDRVTGVVVENTLGKTVTDSGTTAAPSDDGGDSGPPWGQIGVVLVAVPILYGGWRYYEGRQDEGDVDAEE